MVTTNGGTVAGVATPLTTMAYSYALAPRQKPPPQPPP
jgi:hypothetical protein